MSKDVIDLDKLEEILLQETGVIDSNDVPALLATIRGEGIKEQYELLHVQGCVEPALVGETAVNWYELEHKIIEFLVKGEYNPDEDGLFFIRLNPDKTLKVVCSFSNTFMDKMKERAKKRAEDRAKQPAAEKPVVVTNVRVDDIPGLQLMCDICEEFDEDLAEGGSIERIQEAAKKAGWKWIKDQNVCVNCVSEVEKNGKAQAAS